MALSCIYDKALMRRIAVPLCATLLCLASTLTGQQAATNPQSGAVTLQPGDVIRVQIWREEDLSGEFPIDHQGTVVLPLVGAKTVTGIPMDSLRDLLIEGYRVHLRNPSINVTPLRRVNVLGEVAKPGLYAVDPTITLTGAVALAGGTTSDGDLSRIRIIRDGTVVRERVAAGETLSTVDIRSGDQILVERRSWFERNSTFLVSAVLSVTSIVSSIIIAAKR